MNVWKNSIKWKKKKNSKIVFSRFDDVELFENISNLINCDFCIFDIQFDESDDELINETNNKRMIFFFFNWARFSDVKLWNHIFIISYLLTFLIWNVCSSFNWLSFIWVWKSFIISTFNWAIRWNSIWFWFSIWNSK